MEFEMLFTGIGGQGVQLVAKSLALAATHEGRYAMLSSDVGGSMRGGRSEATVVVGDAPLHALPIIAKASAAIALHQQFWESVASRVGPDALVVTNSSLFDATLLQGIVRAYSVPATDIAAKLGNPLGAGLVLLGAYNVISDVVALSSLIAAMGSIVPSYRRQHVEANERAIRAGAEEAERLGARHAIWPQSAEAE